MATNRRGTLSLTAAMLAAGLLLGSAAQAQNESALPPVQKSGAAGGGQRGVGERRP